MLLPGSSFLEKNGTFTNAERRINRVRKVMPPLAGKEDWEVTMALSNALGYSMHYEHPSEIMDEIAAVTPSFARVSYALLEELGSIQWPCNDERTAIVPAFHDPVLLLDAPMVNAMKRTIDADIAARIR